MKLYLLPLLFLPLTAAHADTFGSGANTFDIDFTTIGNTGNAADDTGYGSVGDTYRIGTYEVSQGMINIYNALSGGPSITYTSLASYGGNGPDKPAGGVTWNEAARFVNWLNTSNGYSAAYKFTTGGFNDNIALWTNGDSGYDPANPFRNSNAYYFLPSEDEWYKAAYYDPNKSGGAGYWDYATGSDSVPTAVSSGTTSGTAVFGQAPATGPAIITNAGGLSPYGTMAQNGNVGEWHESGYTAPNDSADEFRVARGASWTSNISGASLLATNRGNPSTAPTAEFINVGFRVASVPEPSACLLTLLGALGVVLRRRR
jgi:formylglycine-generating enzyme required for sulfatase activity